MIPKLVSLFKVDSDEQLPVYIFFTRAKLAGFPMETLARLLQHTYTATGLNINFSQRVKYNTSPPIHILHAGVCGLPVSRPLGISRKNADDPNVCMTLAYRLSEGGTTFHYLPPVDVEDIANNWQLAQGEYVIWLDRLAKGNEWG